MCWDALLEQQRLKKYQMLQQRVGIQRDLISKNDELSSELRRRDEEEKLEVCCYGGKKEQKKKQKKKKKNKILSLLIFFRKLKLESQHRRNWQKHCDLIQREVSRLLHAYIVDICTLCTVVQEHKKRTAEKLNALKLAEEQQDNVNVSTEEFPSPVHAGLTHGVATSDEHEQQCNPQDDNVNAIHQMLGGGMTVQIYIIIASI